MVHVAQDLLRHSQQRSSGSPPRHVWHRFPKQKSHCSKVVARSGAPMGRFEARRAEIVGQTTWKGSLRQSAASQTPLQPSQTWCSTSVRLHSVQLSSSTAGWLHARQMVTKADEDALDGGVTEVNAIWRARPSRFALCSDPRTRPSPRPPTPRSLRRHDLGELGELGEVGLKGLA